jgi:hypothetical protein
MNESYTIPPAVAALIPIYQLSVTNDHPEAHEDSLRQLEDQLAKCPRIKETDGLPEHPAIFHYFYGGTDDAGRDSAQLILPIGKRPVWAVYLYL